MIWFLWQSRGLVDGLLPVLADLSLHDAGRASLSATQAFGCLVNKLSDTSRVQNLVSALLSDLPLTPTSLGSLVWLTKAVWQRGSPPACMHALLTRIVEVIARPEQDALAFQAADGLRVVIRDSPHILCPRAAISKTNPLWRQRLFHQALPLLKSQAAHSPALLLAICNLTAAVPQSVIQADLDSIVPFVLQVWAWHSGI